MTEKKEKIEKKTCPNIRMEMKQQAPNLGFSKVPYLEKIKASNLGFILSLENGIFNNTS